MEGSVYLKARQEGDERYADLVLGKRNWQIAAAGMMAITLVLAVGMVLVSTRSRFVPYVFEVDKLGYASPRRARSWRAPHRSAQTG
jgi:type IV secretion system protein TrbF